MVVDHEHIAHGARAMPRRMARGGVGLSAVSVGGVGLSVSIHGIAILSCFPRCVIAAPQRLLIRH
jgi:hypothetical protein